MIWSEFRTRVLTDLPVDKNRINIATGNPNYLDQQIIHCLNEIQELITYYQQGHETVYGTEDLVLDGLASRGRIPDGAYPKEAYYKQVGRVCVSQPLWQYDWGNRFDLVCGAPKVISGQFFLSIDPKGREFYAFPSVLDQHQVSLFWDGIKTEFEDSEETPFDDAIAECVGLFCKARIARLVDHDLVESESYQRTYERRRALIYADRLGRGRLAYSVQSQAQGNGCANAITACPTIPAVPVDDLVQFCAFGDSGDTANMTNTLAVATLVKSLEPDFIMHLGDSCYPNADPPLIQQALIEPYGNYIPSNFLLAWGNHDVEVEDGAYLYELLAKQKALNEGKRYYSFIPPGEKCQLFVLDTQGDPAEQATWLQLMLSQSSYWNIVCMHKAPYTSDVNHAPGDLNWRFPFGDWGAHVVISGHAHNYERLLVDGFQYIVCGLGGAPKRGFVSPPTTGSQFRYNTFYGTLYITAKKDQLQITFYDTRGEAVDSVQWQTTEEFGPGPQPPEPAPAGEWCQLRGSVAPEGVYFAAEGCWYRRNDGVNYEFWFKESGGASQFGWVMTEKFA